MNTNVWFVIFTLIFCLSVSAAPKDIHINQDVFVCGQTVRALVSTEYQFFTGQNLKFPIQFESVQSGLHWLKSDLGTLSPSRVRLLENILGDQGTTVLLKKGVEIQRVTLGSNRILPTGCDVKPLSVFTISSNPGTPAYSVIINQDLLEKMSIDDQVYEWWGLSLDIEQALFENEKTRNDLTADFEFDMVKSRDFIQCWMDSGCKPVDIKSYHQFSKNLKLHYLEQSGVLVPVDRVKVESTGLIKFVRWVVSFLDKKIERIFSSSISIPSQSEVNVLGYFSELDPLVQFNQLGRSVCAAVRTAEKKTGTFRGTWTSATSENSFPFSIPVCWDYEGNLTQGYFAVSWEKPFQFILNDQIMIVQGDPLAGGNDQGTAVTLYPNGNIHWILKVSGLQKLGNKLVSMMGPIKFRDDQSVECARTNTKVFELTCFDRSGKPEKIFSYYEFVTLFNSELTSGKPEYLPGINLLPSLKN